MDAYVRKYWDARDTLSPGAPLGLDVPCAGCGKSVSLSHILDEGKGLYYLVFIAAAVAAFAGYVAYKCFR